MTRMLPRNPCHPKFLQTRSHRLRLPQEDSSSSISSGTPASKSEQVLAANGMSSKWDVPVYGMYGVNSWSSSQKQGASLRSGSCGCSRCSFSWHFQGCTCSPCSDVVSRLCDSHQPRRADTSSRKETTDGVRRDVHLTLVRVDNNFVEIATWAGFMRGYTSSIRNALDILDIDIDILTFSPSAVHPAISAAGDYRVANVSASEPGSTSPRPQNNRTESGKPTTPIRDVGTSGSSASAGPGSTAAAAVPCAHGHSPPADCGIRDTTRASCPLSVVLQVPVPPALVSGAPECGSGGLIPHASLSGLVKRSKAAVAA